MATVTLPAALPACVKLILCGLSGATLAALRSIIDANITALNAAVLGLEAQILTFDVLVIGPQLAAAAGQAILAQLKGATTIIPLALIGDCVGLGDLTVDLTKGLDVLSAEIEDHLLDLNRLLSFKEELTALKLELTGVIDRLNAIILVMESCQ